MSPRSIVFTEPHHVTLADVVYGALDPRDVLIRSRWSLVSNGTELSYLDGSNPKAKYPKFPGHSVVGHVEAVGADVTRCTVGDRVFAFGSHASHVVVDAAQVFPLPDETVSDKAALFCNMVGIAAPAVVACRSGGDTDAGVVGLGLFGQVIARMLTHEQWRSVTGSSQSKFRRAVAPVDTTTRLEPDSCDATVETTGIAKRITEALKATRPGGRVVLFGHPRAPVRLDVYRLVQRKGMTIIGVQLGIRSLFVSDPVADLIDAAQAQVTDLDVESIITDVVAPSAMPAMYAVLAEHSDHLGVVIDWKSP